MHRQLLSSLLVIGLYWSASKPEAVYAEAPQEMTNSIGMKLRLIPAGEFMMGSPPDEQDSEDDERQHKVKITRNYWLGVHEVTQAQYLQIMGKNPSTFQGDKVAERHPETNRVLRDVDSSNHPVDCVSWMDAVEFCERLSRKEGKKYRLPTEAEWEYACRAGTTGPYVGTGKLDELGWYADNSVGKTHPVGQKKPNAWWLYDMHGNVLEWCLDWYGEDYYRKSSVNDPSGPSEGSDRVIRGSSWYSTPAYCRSSNRSLYSPDFRSNNLGFRVALVP